MIAWVYRRARETPCLDRLLVATDAEEIAAYCRSANIPVAVTSHAHRSGTDRALEVMARDPADICVNIQGDEPMVTAEHLELLVRPFAEAPETQVTTLMVPITHDEARDPNVVKIVRDSRGHALYFSRALIPCDRDGSGGAPYYKHLGFYAYTAAALERFSRLPPSRLELVERLEQLRFLENGIPITVSEAAEDTIGVDTDADLRKVEEYFRRVGARLPNA
jgi:3-deoxy-manno-octulosonate cytidylyltransferase (CMP-KDO synthetase)